MYQKTHLVEMITLGRVRDLPKGRRLSEDVPSLRVAQTEKVAENVKSCRKCQKLPKSCRATCAEPYCSFISISFSDFLLNFGIELLVIFTLCTKMFEFMYFNSCILGFPLVFLIPRSFNFFAPRGDLLPLHCPRTGHSGVARPG